MKQFPQWIKRPMPTKTVEQMNRLLKEYNVHTVCQSARCPNIGECFKRREVTFMILGNICTRNCRFCSVRSEASNKLKLDVDEPNRIARAVMELGIKYVVITSVTRDDLPDGGAGHFAATINAVRPYNHGTKIEILTPDFNNDITALKTIIDASPDVFAHNIETVPRLYESIRPRASYTNSITILSYIKNNSDILTKSGIMLGLGETEKEIFETIKDLRDAGCDILTIGQYLKPSADCVEVQEFIRPEKFQYYKEIAEKLGFASVVSGPFIRSSYMAREAYMEVIKKYERSYA